MEKSHLRELFAECAFSAIVIQPAYRSLVEQLSEGQDLLCIYASENGQASDLCFDQLVGNFNESEHPVGAEDVVYLNVTSGTTGRPKSAIGTHAQILWNALATVETLDFREDDVFLCMFSAFSHPHELFHRSLITGATIVLIDTLNPRVVAATIETHRVTWMMAVPAFYEMMLSHLSPGAVDLSSLRMLESGGAWVSSDTVVRIEREFGCTFLPVWGSTETHGVVLALLPAEDRRLGATGRVIDYYSIDVVDRHGSPVPPGTTGELIVSGSAVATGYFRPVAGELQFRDGRYFTGDLVRMDEDGFIWFVGRKNDLMKVGGVRVFPLEIERAVVEHPSVAAVSVVRANERVRGEIPRAIVCLHSGQSLSSNELKAWCRQHLAVYKVPRIVEFWPSLPRLPNGKVDRRGIEATPIGQVA